ncbi:MAG: RNA methyltransferase [Bacteroidota bacterium]
MPLPAAFVAQMQDLLQDDYADFENALQQAAPVSIRYNPRKNTSHSLEKKVLWNPQAYYLEGRPVFTLDPHFHAGVYYVQEASSMFVAEAANQLLDFDRPLKVLDLCAAPGGKSTALLSLLNEESILVSNEVIKSRYHILRENLTKWGNSNVFVTNHDPKDFEGLEGFFDLVLVDAPCSGEGLFRKDARAMQEWSPEAVQHCSARQRRILSIAPKLVKKDGILMYCTCTYNTTENMDNVHWLLETNDLAPEQLILAEDWKIREVRKEKAVGYQFFPHLVKGEGFFIACLKQKEDFFHTPKKKKSTFAHLQKVPKKQLEAIHLFVRKDLSLDFFQTEKGRIFAFPASLTSTFIHLSASLKKSAYGAEIGIIKGKSLVPAHALAMSHLITPDFPKLALDKQQALQFLKKLPVEVDGSKEGWHLVTYENSALGWAKVLKRRMNNYYPKEWRIRMEI